MKAKKLISAAMALVLVCGAPVVSYDKPFIQMQTSAADYTIEKYGDLFNYYKYSDHIKIRGAVDKTNLETLEIPSEIDGLPVTIIGNSAFSGCTLLESVTMPNSITSIESSAFSGCTLLKSVTMPDSITSIGDLAFYNCMSLCSVKISNNVKTMEYGVFEGCISLTSVTIPESVAIMENSVFWGCKKLESVKFLARNTILGSSVFNTPGSNVVIYGYEGSTIQEYAEENKLNFEILGDEPQAEEPTSAPSAGKADVNGDGKADASDASDILRYYAHLSTGGKLSFEEFIKK
ncbi:MAG: leucine-rich repeat protein [Ruminococcus sp.]|nr:leucine-rich repeat protein [Ruminococcus sp.]